MPFLGSQIHTGIAVPGASSPTQGQTGLQEPASETCLWDLDLYESLLRTFPLQPGPWLSLLITACLLHHWIPRAWNKVGAQ